MPHNDSNTYICAMLFILGKFSKWHNSANCAPNLSISQGAIAPFLNSWSITERATDFGSTSQHSTKSNLYAKPEGGLLCNACNDRRYSVHHIKNKERTTSVHFEQQQNRDTTSIIISFYLDL